jgi:hypothetical protein
MLITEAASTIISFHAINTSKDGYRKWRYQKLETSHTASPLVTIAPYYNPAASSICTCGNMHDLVPPLKNNDSHDLAHSQEVDACSQIEPDLWVVVSLNMCTPRSDALTLVTSMSSCKACRKSFRSGFFPQNSLVFVLNFVREVSFANFPPTTGLQEMRTIAILRRGYTCLL